MGQVRKDDPVEEFLTTYERSHDDLLPEDRLSAPGLFAGEEEFIRFADNDYEGDRHWAFEIRADRCALVVVDMQEDFVNPGNPMCVPEAYRQVPRVKKLIEGAREADVPVFYTEHHVGADCSAGFYEYWPPIASGAIKEGEEATRVYHGLDPQPGERIITTKHNYDSFAGTDLDYVLRDRKVETVIVCGTLTNFCVESTARTAYFLGYNVVFGSDVSSTDDALAHVATLRTMRRGFARVMDHVSILEALQDDRFYREAKAGREEAPVAQAEAA